MLGDHSVVDPPDSMPNSEVKRNSADGSVGFPHVRVGHRQAHILEKPVFSNGLFWSTGYSISCADIAQVVERILGKDEVPSSSLGISTSYLLFKTNRQNLLGDHSVVDPPDSMPNSEVKRNSADGSVGSPHVRVGHRQALFSCFQIFKTFLLRGSLKAKNLNENPSICAGVSAFMGQYIYLQPDAIML